MAFKLYVNSSQGDKDGLKTDIGTATFYTGGSLTDISLTESLGDPSKTVYYPGATISFKAILKNNSTIVDFSGVSLVDTFPVLTEASRVTSTSVVSLRTTGTLAPNVLIDGVAATDGTVSLDTTNKTLTLTGLNFAKGVTHSVQVLCKVIDAPF